MSNFIEKICREIIMKTSFEALCDKKRESMGRDSLTANSNNYQDSNLKNIESVCVCVTWVISKSIIESY